MRAFSVLGFLETTPIAQVAPLARARLALRQAKTLLASKRPAGERIIPIHADVADLP
ncbi:MAG: hypothetical protein ACP5PV_09760 [Methanothrix sp.]